METELLGGPLYVIVPFVLVVATPVAILLAVFIQNRYRKRVTQLMGMKSEPTKTVDDLATASNIDDETDSTDLIFNIEEPNSEIPLVATAKTLAEKAKKSRYRLATVYALGGMVQALIITILYFLVSDIYFSLYGILIVWLIFGWPVTLSVVEILSVNNLRRWLIPFLILLGFIVLLPADAKGVVLFVWPGFIGVPFLVLLLAFSLKFRALMPIIFMFSIYIFFVSTIWLTFFDFLMLKYPRSKEIVGSILFVAAIISLIYGGRIIARRFSKDYLNRKYNDQMLFLNTFFLLFTIWECIFISSSLWDSGYPLILGYIGMLGYVGYEVTVKWGLQRVRNETDVDQNVNLMLLRVFRFQSRTEKLFREISLRWRYIGNIQLIAAPDLASVLLNPHKLIDFIGGRTKTGFVQNSADLDQRIQELDAQPDPDSRYRVNEFYGYEDTWLITVRRLMARSNAVLMDLRSFSRSSRGCIEEINLIFSIVALKHVIFMIDEDTDLTHLKKIMRLAFETREPASPNRLSSKNTVNLVRIDKFSERLVNFLLKKLYSAVKFDRDNYLMIDYNG